MATRSAADLPAGSIVATANRVWMKKTDREGPYWIAAETYAVQTTDIVINGVLADGATVLRVGDGREAT